MSTSSKQKGRVFPGAAFVTTGVVTVGMVVTCVLVVTTGGWHLLFEQMAPLVDDQFLVSRLSPSLQPLRW